MPAGQFDPPTPPPPPIPLAGRSASAPTPPVPQPVGAVRRLFNIVFGSFLIFIGILMIFIPGPGIASILAGLNLVKPDNRISQYIRARLEKRELDKSRPHPPPPPQTLT